MSIGDEIPSGIEELLAVLRRAVAEMPVDTPPAIDYRPQPDQERQ